MGDETTGGGAKCSKVCASVDEDSCQVDFGIFASFALDVATFRNSQTAICAIAHRAVSSVSHTARSRSPSTSRDWSQG